MPDIPQAMRVFVSHSHEDDAFCQRLVSALRRAGANVWYDEHNMDSGLLLDTIERELRARPVFVLILSPAALASQWVRDESKWAYARLRRDPSRIILPVLAVPLADEDDIWMFLQDFKRIEAPGIQPFPVDEAVRRTLRALALTPAGEAPAPVAPQPSESADDLIARGKALRTQGKHAEALPLLERATQLAPSSFDAWFNLGFSRVELGQYQQGIAAYDRALAINPNDAPSWSNKGKALRDLKRPEEALAAYERALALDPSFAIAWYGKGALFHDLKRDEEALDAFNRALALGYDGVAAWNAKAIVFRVLGRKAEAGEAEARAKALGG
ncbi:MAG TPA: toll/interleukin-1 receptor domain-containing protein [Ktedonobacterales bacterium]